MPLDMRTMTLDGVPLDELALGQGPRQQNIDRAVTCICGRMYTADGKTTCGRCTPINKKKPMAKKKETAEQELRRLCCEKVLKALRGEDPGIDAVWVGHAMRLVRTMEPTTPDEDPVAKEVAKLAREAGGKLPPVDTEFEDAATRQRRRTPQ